jgi:predicted Zn finger-like uncharacterized protein
MSIRTVCPSCRTVYNLDESFQGKTVRCRECKSPIAVPSPSRQVRHDESSRPPDDRISKSSKSSSAAGPASRDDEKPQRRSAERRSPRNSEDSQGNKNLIPIFLVVGASVLLLGGLVIGGVVFAVIGMNKSSDAVGPVAIVVNEPSPERTQGKADAAPGPGARPVAAPPSEPQNKALPPGPLADLQKRLDATLPNGPRAEPGIPAGPVPREMAIDVL